MQRQGSRSPLITSRQVKLHVGLPCSMSSGGALPSSVYWTLQPSISAQRSSNGYSSPSTQSGRSMGAEAIGGWFRPPLFVPCNSGQEIVSQGTISGAARRNRLSPPAHRLIGSSQEVAENCRPQKGLLNPRRPAAGVRAATPRRPDRHPARSACYSAPSGPLLRQVDPLDHGVVDRLVARAG